jgi:Kef-type K+ transport system membrane component KefB
MKRQLIGYLALITVFGALISGLLYLGSGLEVQVPPGGAQAGQDQSAGYRGIAAGFIENLTHPVSTLFIQLIVIVVAARLAGVLFQRLGQPAVVGEMAAGILLGPSLLGWLLPETFSFIFPAHSLGTLRLLSQIGVCLFMFVVGMELNVGQLRDRAHVAVVVSHASIVFPYFLGVASALILFVPMAPAGVSFVSFALFMGIAMSITAFPVLARILDERGLSRTPLGVTAITCAAVDDVTAWSLLAFVIAVVQMTSIANAVLTIALSGIFVGLMLFAVKPTLLRIIPKANLHGEAPGAPILALVLLVVFGAALTTEVIGIHALFGAFLAGVIMPDSKEFRAHLHERLERFSSVFLLPLFFAFTGLRTQIGLIHDMEGWLWCLLIVAVATFGKLGGSMLAARWGGLSWSDSFKLGALMNTRGLMELIALNIGYDLGILSPRIFTIMVIMALVTTLMTGPLLWLADWLRSTRAARVVTRTA